MLADSRCDLRAECTRVVTFERAAEARGNRLEALYVLAINTGIRQGELLGLQWSDIDWTSRSLSISRGLQELKNGTMAILPPKTAASRRRVALSDGSISVLRKHQAAMFGEGHRVLADGLVSVLPSHEAAMSECACVWLFCDTKGQPLRKSNFVRRSFQPLLKAAGLPKTFTFHDLRHTAATPMLLSNESPKVVSEMLGHSRIAITMDVYSEVMPGMQQGAVDRLAALLAAATAGAT